MKLALIILFLVVLWYAFGRKWQFINYCIKRDGNEQWNSMPEGERKSNCERMYNGFSNSRSVNWMPFAFY